MERDAEEIRLVVDTNILISALLKDDSITARLLRSNACSYYYPWDGLTEINYYRDYIISKRNKHIQASSFEHALQFVLGSISVVPSEMYSYRMKEAFSIIKDRDPKDTPFLALALQLGSPLWSNDKHFQDLPEVIAYSTGALIEHMRSRGIWW
ncbi:MAG: putative nucleotide-binding protein, containing PIN domain [Euryarchaeota archaeon ADurb.Bin190]|jgi:predicted nucleic acid-binding protein|nr:MAG: putative nucleotide-binding protein, containing PIN domain [Euryarchaeota archaeon ADurb.Bin190]HNQ55678.1 PIN domain-containing protein [Methanothrix sp.]HNU40783.1 PIN domain-containing protein [Methanothrix sp.]